MKQTVKKAFSLLALILVLLLPLCKAFAEGGGTLSVSYPYEGAVFSVFRVAVAGEGGGYLPADSFAGYGVDIPGESWLDTAATLAAYAARDGLEPDAEAAVSGGRAVFPRLEEGLYLVTGSVLRTGGKIYTPAPFLAWIPAGGNVTAEEKYGVEEETPGTVPYKVEKVWKNDRGQKRPKSVKVQLLKDGVVYGTVELSRANGWTYAWESHDAGATWQAAEQDVPENYAVSVSREGTAFTVTNTCRGEPCVPPGEEAVKTGDKAPLGLYCLSAVLSLSALASAALYRRCRKGRRTRLTKGL